MKSQFFVKNDPKGRPKYSSRDIDIAKILGANKSIPPYLTVDEKWRMPTMSKWEKLPLKVVLKTQKSASFFKLWTFPYVSKTLKYYILCKKSTSFFICKNKISITGHWMRQTRTSKFSIVFNEFNISGTKILFAKKKI